MAPLGRPCRRRSALVRTAFARCSGVARTPAPPRQRAKRALHIVGSVVVASSARGTPRARARCAEAHRIQVPVFARILDVEERPARGPGPDAMGGARVEIGCVRAGGLRVREHWRDAGRRVWRGV